MKNILFLLSICFMVSTTACQQDPASTNSDKNVKTSSSKKASSNKAVEGSKIDIRANQLAEKYCRCNKRKSNIKICKSEIKGTFEVVHKRLAEQHQTSFKESFEKSIAACK